MACGGKCEPVKSSNSASMKQGMAVLSVLGMLPWAGLNAQQTATFKVAARVEESCNFSALGATLLRATCTPNATYYFGLDRRLSPGADTVTGVGTGQAVDHTLFGGFPAARVVPVGELADTIAVRVFY
jgi:spore coat protein U-like protein